MNTLLFMATAPNQYTNGGGLVADGLALLIGIGVGVVAYMIVQQGNDEGRRLKEASLRAEYGRLYNHYVELRGVLQEERKQWAYERSNGPSTRSWRSEPDRRPIPGEGDVKSRDELVQELNAHELKYLRGEDHHD